MGIDSVGYVVCVYIAAIGADNRAIIDPVDMFDIALAKQSKKVIIAHNHPSETKKINPSENDFDLTNKLYHACLPFGIEIIPTVHRRVTTLLLPTKFFIVMLNTRK